MFTVSMLFLMKTLFIISVNNLLQKGERLCLSDCEDSMKNCIDMPIFHTLFVSERKQIAMIADANLRFASPLRD